MKITHLPEDGKNFIPYEVSGKTIDFDDGELMFNVSKKERDYEVVIDICEDYTGGLVMGADASMLHRSLFLQGNIQKWKKKIRTMIRKMKREPNSLLSKS